MEREQALSRDFFGILGLVGATVFIGIVCVLLTRHGCLHPGPPVSVPDPGTARAGFCSAIGGEVPWLLVLGAPCAIVAASALFWRGSHRGLLLIAILVWIAQIGVAGAANSLAYSLTI
jgi:hypothetical protein